MFSEQYALLRSKTDGKYLAAVPDPDGGDRYLLLFRESFDALSYLNKYASDLKSSLEVETAAIAQVKSLLVRWEYAGVGLVRDPLLPSIDFMTRDRSSFL